VSADLLAEVKLLGCATVVFASHPVVVVPVVERVAAVGKYSVAKLLQIGIVGVDGASPLVQFDQSRFEFV
jgi:hypothetical protein